MNVPLQERCRESNVLWVGVSVWEHYGSNSARRPLVQTHTHTQQGTTGHAPILGTIMIVRRLTCGVLSKMTLVRSDKAA